jgi:CheY-like chemotaxis protein
MPAMPNKALRILIADKQHTHRLVLERLFNQQGYFRIVPVSDLQELLTLVGYDGEPFDLVVANAGLANGALDLHEFIIDNRQILNALVYNAPQVGRSSVPVARRPSLHLSHAQLPDRALLQRLMERVDRPASEPLPSWGQPLRQGCGG